MFAGDAFGAAEAGAGAVAIALVAGIAAGSVAGLPAARLAPDIDSGEEMTGSGM